MDRQEEQPFIEKDLKTNASVAPIKASHDSEMENVKFETAMEIAGFGKFSVFAIFLSALTIGSAFTSSIDASFLLPAAQCDLNLSSDDKGLLGSAFFLGAISVSHLTGFLADTLGRKYVLVRGLWGNFIVYILGSVAPNFWTLFILKLLSGMLSAPCYIATFPFLGEYVPTQDRFRSVMIATACSILGLAYSNPGSLGHAAWTVGGRSMAGEVYPLATVLPHMWCAGLNLRHSILHNS
ncbi:synaptic vesicle glycoprotein 2B-like isoform X2 [Homalodisca vitripennis]|uniref:synaptic vesicle glycoprotein 2B-like isoform X2 n=1 Tax=Homalodisca vitripennis TaxID=197043 RepID=UPI001EEB1F2F|nr:synaptic vesicle glycoprotein 2B-like isoform X2 [Homalodisca vitripennis]